MLMLDGLIGVNSDSKIGFRKELLDGSPEEYGIIIKAYAGEVKNDEEDERIFNLGRGLFIDMILEDGFTHITCVWPESKQSTERVLDLLSAKEISDLIGMKVVIIRSSTIVKISTYCTWLYPNLVEYSDIDAIITREHFNELVELYGTCPGMTKDLRRMRDTLLEVAKRRMIDDIMSGEKKYPIRYIRISPETGNILERGYKDITLSYLGYKKIVSMPGWYDKDFDEGIHSKEDMKVSDEALSELKSKALKSGSRKSMLEEK